MSLGEAIEILRKEKEFCDLRISNGTEIENDEKFSSAVDVVMDWVDKMYTALMRLN